MNAVAVTPATVASWTLETAPGVRLCAPVLTHEPRGAGKRPVILVLPAMGVRATYYTPLANALHAAGCDVVTTEQRGNGSSTVRASRQVDFGYAELVRDLTTTIEQVAERFPGAPIHLLGHSLGGQLGLVALGRHRHPRVASIVLVASCSVYYGGYPFPRRLGLWALTQSFGLLARLLGYFPGRRVGFGGHEARGVMRDWSHQARTGRYRLRDGGPDAESGLRALACPVLAVSVEGDTLAPATAIDHLCGKLERAEVTRWHAPPPPDARLDHFRWVAHHQTVVERIVTWIG